MGNGGTPRARYDLRRLERHDEQAWREFVITITPRLEARAWAVLSKIGRPRDRAAVKSAAADAVVRTWEGICRGKITRTPEVAALFYIPKVIAQDYREATRGGKLDYPEDFDPEQQIPISAGASLSMAREFFENLEEALHLWGGELELIREERPRTDVSDSFLQVAALDLIFHEWESIDSQVKLLELRNLVQFRRIRDRGLSQITNQLAERHQDADLVRMVDFVGDIILDRWSRSFVPCFPYLEAHHRLGLDLDGSERIHRHVHVEVLRCESCLSWKNKSRAQVAELEITQSVIHETMKSIREVTGGSS